MSEQAHTLLIRKRKLTWIERLAESNSPEKLLLIAFVLIILGGSVLLSMPFANLRTPAVYLDNLFTAVSAVCVTGLSTVTAAAQYNLFGKIILILLMETGGLGPMTIIAIIMQRNRRMATAEKKLFAAASGKSNLDNVPDYIRKIIIYTAVFELTGFIVLAARLVGFYGWKEGLFNALFLSVSAFTNAGFDPIGADSLAPFVLDPLVNLTIIFLITTGGLGFVVWFELTDLFRSRKDRGSLLRRRHRYLSEHATAVLWTSLILVVTGLFFFLVNELHNPGTLDGMSPAQKLLVSLFQSVTLRTAGFSTIRIGACTRPVLLIMCIYMIIGGSPGGTAGGIKTTTAAVLYKSTVNTLNRKHGDAVIRHRRVSSSVLKQAYMITTLYMAIIFVMTVILTITEPETDLLSLLFEVFSAIATVGISAGITSSLSVTGKAVIMILMFIGRLGPLSIYTAFHKEVRTSGHVRYPDANIIIG